MALLSTMYTPQNAVGCNYLRVFWKTHIVILPFNSSLQSFITVNHGELWYDTLPQLTNEQDQANYVQGTIS